MSFQDILYSLRITLVTTHLMKAWLRVDLLYNAYGSCHANMTTVYLLAVTGSVKCYADGHVL
jgi:hypothetical protein